MFVLDIFDVTDPAVNAVLIKPKDLTPSVVEDLSGGVGEVVEGEKPVPDCGIKTRR